MFQGNDTQKVILEFKFFKKKNSKRATKVMKINSTVGELNKAHTFNSILLSDVGKDDHGRHTLYTSSSTMMKRLANMGCSNSCSIPKSYDSIEQFSVSMYDMLILSNVEYKIEKV